LGIELLLLCLRAAGKLDLFAIWGQGSNSNSLPARGGQKGDPIRFDGLPCLDIRGGAKSGGFEPRSVCRSIIFVDGGARSTARQPIRYASTGLWPMPELLRAPFPGRGLFRLMSNSLLLEDSIDSAVNYRGGEQAKILGSSFTSA